MPGDIATLFPVCVPTVRRAISAVFNVPRWFAPALPDGTFFFREDVDAGDTWRSYVPLRTVPARAQ
jgi:hypothetical protein